jgi:hypothetical protein
MLFGQHDIPVVEVQENQLVVKVAYGQEWSSVGDHFPVIVEVARA